MAAFMKLGDIQGESTDANHDKWILIQSMSSPIFRSIPEGAKDNERSFGETTLGDIVVVRQLDKSSVKLQEACANGTFFGQVDIEFTTQASGSGTTYLKYILKDVIVSSYSFHGNSSGDPIPSEEVSLSYTEVEWTYTIIDSSGSAAGNVAAGFNPGTGESTT